jgi:hypothetical protein
MPIVFGIGILALVAIGFLSRSFSPFATGIEVKFLFLLSAFIILVSLALIVVYAISMVWHQGWPYFLVRYFGPEAPYFRLAFRRSVLIAILSSILFLLSRYDLLTKYFIGGSTIIILIIEIIYSVHEKKRVDF